MKSIYYIISAINVPRSNCGTKIPAIAARWEKLFPNPVRLICSTDHTFDRYLAHGTSGRRQLQHRRGSVEGYKASPLRRFLRDILILLHEACLYVYLRRRFKTEPPAVVWHRESRLCFATMMAAKAAGAVYVVEILDSLEKNGSPVFHWLHQAIERAAVQSAALVIVVSKEWAQLSQQQFGGALEKYQVIYNTVDPEKFKCAADMRTRKREEIRFKEHEIIIGYVGSYAWYHNIELLKTFILNSLAHPETKTRIKWLLVGEGEGRRIIQNSLVDHPNKAQVTMIDWTAPDDIPTYLNTMDFAILPGSLPIICPIKVFEYMAAGAIPIIPDTPANREVVVDGVNGILFEPDNAESALTKFISIAGSPEIMRTIGDHVRQRIAMDFHLDRVFGAPMRKALELFQHRR